MWSRPFSSGAGDVIGRQAARAPLSRPLEKIDCQHEDFTGGNIVKALAILIDRHSSYYKSPLCILRFL